MLPRVGARKDAHTGGWTLEAGEAVILAATVMIVVVPRGVDCSHATRMQSEIYPKPMPTLF